MIGFIVNFNATSNATGRYAFKSGEINSKRMDFRRRQHRCVSMGLKESSERVFSWVSDNGANLSDYSLVQNESLVELVSKKGVRSDQELIRIAPKLCISGSTSRKVFGKCVDFLDDDEVLIALQLLYEVHQGKDSKFELYVSHLQSMSYPNHVLLWTRKELELLRGSPIYISAINVQKTVRDVYEQLFEQLIPQCSSILPADFFTFDRYLWAIIIVQSRAFEFLPEFPLVLVPVLDEINHANFTSDGSGANAALSVARVGWLREAQPAIRSITEVKPDAKIRLEYPGENRGEMLLRYGFVDGGVDCVVMKFEVSQFDPFSDDKADILEQQGLNEVVLFKVFSDELETVAKEILQLSRLISLTAVDAFLLEAVFRSDVWDFMAEPVSEVNEAAACAMIISECRALLEDYMTDEEKDSALKEADGVTLLRSELASTIVDGEKIVLEKLIAIIQEEVDSMDAKEYYQERRLRDLDLLRPVDESEIVDGSGTRRAGQAFDQYY